MKNKKYADIPVGKADSEGAFFSSLDDFSAEEIEVLAEKKIKKRSISFGSLIQYTFMFICAAVFVVCLYLIADNLIDKYRGNQIYDEAASIFKPITITDSTGSDSGLPEILTPYEKLAALDDGNEGVTENSYNMDLTSVKASLSALRQQNSDVVGWIYIENTRINYPLMQSSSGDDEYYLTHAYTGEYLAVGSIYLVSNCDKVLNNNYNSLIYGHNIANGTMFHDVLSFVDPELFQSSLIYIYTLDGAYIYKPFSIYETTSDYNYIQTYFSNESEFIAFADRVKGNSHIANDISVSSGDSIITLSTCTNGGVGTPGRWALHAKLIAVVE